jgi:hypothetical protein
VIVIIQIERFLSNNKQDVNVEMTDSKMVDKIQFKATAALGGNQ